MTAIRVPVTKTDPSPKFLAEQERKIAERIARRDAKILERFIRRLNSWQPRDAKFAGNRAGARRALPWSLPCLSRAHHLSAGGPGAKALRAPALRQRIKPSRRV
jgi:hypothetical protein